ncbi:hypothetical protein RSSM_05846 [Rhodopirellula sallentina SM41]|uniref:Uncharacterized protein n=1 Tax=Rhodopirellula sallentina SM41 TaxID=1263870 RepID=M5TUC2_9BACT|nr:hypothetical protein RSSM_05846 [Rhodopirellula sallentina SM41]
MNCQRHRELQPHGGLPASWPNLPTSSPNRLAAVFALTHLDQSSAAVLSDGQASTLRH